MPKKILFVITKSNWGGAQRYVYDLATSLPKDQFDVAVALGGSGPLAIKLKIANIKVIGIPHLERDVNLIKESLSTIYLWQIFKDEKPDIIHLNSSKVGGLGAIAAYALKLMNRRNIELKDKFNAIFTVHGWAFNESRRSLQQGVIYLLQWITAAFCEKVIVLSRHDYRQAVQMPLIRNGKFSIIPLGIRDLEFLTKAQAKKFLKIDPHNPAIGTIAELTRNKGLEYLIDSVKQIGEGIKTIIIGEGEKRRELEAQIEQLELKEKVLLKGFVEDAAKYIKAFDVYVCSSIKEGLPYTIIEAMQAGLPVIASSVGGLTDMIENEKNGFLLSPKNPETIAECINKLMKDENLRKKFSHRSREIAEEKFSLERMLSSTIDIYNKE